MGEYALYRGMPVKLGTCEDLYYVRYADFARMVAARELERYIGSDAPAAYLDGSYRFRFPFPDEDDRKPFTYDDFDKGFLVDVTAAPDLVTMAEHRHTSASLHPRGGGYNVSVTFPCPQTEDFETVQSSGIDWRILEIVQQRPFEGSLWTVCRCPYCGVKWRLDAEQAETLAALLLGAGAMLADYRGLIAERILAGYMVNTGAADDFQ